MSRSNNNGQHDHDRDHHHHHQEHHHEHHDSEEHEHDQSNLDVHSLSLAYQTYLRHDDDEKNHFDEVCRSFRQYATFAMAQWANQQYRIHSLSESQRQVLPNALKRDTAEFNQRSTQWRDAAIRNQFCVDCILRHAGIPHSQQVTTPTRLVSDSQISKVSSVLKSLARDWSTEGKAERDMAYGPILKQVKKFLPLTDTCRPRICVPGAGVGRLAFELTNLGYCVQGNDFSLFMLLASDFILNSGTATPEHPLKISPWLLESRNVHHPEHPVRYIEIPDVDPFSISGGAEDGRPAPEFSMAAGEFGSIYGHSREAGQWDAVTCCFFLDACPNMVEHIQLIFRMLKPGGYLIHFGPLLYHWSGPAMRPDDKSVDDYQARYSFLDQRYMSSVDLCYEDVKQIMRNVGFEIKEEKTGIKSLYTADFRSMMNMVYHCVSLVARKPLDWAPNGSDGDNQDETSAF